MRLLIVLLAAVALSACGSTTSPMTAPSDTTGVWQRVAEPPLPLRRGALVAWTGREVLVIGGDDSPPCPPAADCATPPSYRRDGAAFDPQRDSWRTLPRAPVGIPDVAEHAIVGRELFVLAGNDARRLLAFDLDTETWRQVPVDGPLGWADLVADGDRLVVVWGSHEQTRTPDRVLEPASGRWSELPADPLGPAYARAITWTPGGLVLTGKELVPSPGSTEPSVVLAARLDRATGRWTRLPDSEILGGTFTWTGTLMVDATPGGADGGEVNNYGRTVPYGGRLDPVTGRWSDLPDAPPENTGGWPVWAAGGPVIAVAGWLYDDAAGSWTRVPRPEGAPESPGGAAWVGEGLFVYGGETWAGDEVRLSGQAWLSLPPDSWDLP